MAEKIVQTAGRDRLGDFAPEFAHYNDNVLFGENWNNTDIDLRTRSLITVVALMAQGITDSSLKFHIQNAKNHGVTRKEMAAAITHAAFYAGCRNHWHIHKATSGGGQMLICVGGRGYYQEEGKEPVEMTPGKVINISANVKHWHGAAPSSWFSHLSIGITGEGLGTEWLEPVSDGEYSKLK